MRKRRKKKRSKKKRGIMTFFLRRLAGFMLGREREEMRCKERKRDSEYRVGGEKRS